MHLTRFRPTAGPRAPHDPGRHVSLDRVRLAGARDEAREQQLRGLLLRFHQLAFDAVTDFDAAARIYRRCRRAGITPRGIVDCMIAAVAWRNRAVLLSFDADLDRVAHVIGVEMDVASLRA